MEPNWLKKMFERNSAEAAMWPPSMKKMYEEQTGRKLPEDPRIDQLRAEVERLRGDYEQLTQLCKATEERERAALTHVADLRGALVELKAEYESAGSRDDDRRVTYNWSLSRINAAVARTPAQSLAAIEERVLRDAAKQVNTRIEAVKHKADIKWIEGMRDAQEILFRMADVANHVKRGGE